MNRSVMPLLFPIAFTMGLVIGSMISAATGNSDFSVPDSFFSVVVAFGSGIAIGLGVAMAVLWMDKKFFITK